MSTDYIVQLIIIVFYLKARVAYMLGVQPVIWIGVSKRPGFFLISPDSLEI